MSKFSHLRFYLFFAWNIHTIVFLPFFLVVVLFLLEFLLFLVTVICLFFCSFCESLLFCSLHSQIVFHWSLSDNKSPRVSRTLLSILDDLNNAAVWIVSTHPLISKSSGPYTNILVTVPRALIIICITVSFLFHSFFQFSSKVQILILLFALFQFFTVVKRDSKVHNSASCLFCWLS